jgi:hypothetical protein
MDSQHFATSADVERARAELIERMGQLEARLIERIEQSRTDLIERLGQLEIRMVERIERTRTELIERVEQVETRTLRWIAGLFAAQTFVLVAAVLGMIEVLR